MKGGQSMFSENIAKRRVSCICVVFLTMLFLNNIVLATATVLEEGTTLTGESHYYKKLTMYEDEP